MTVVLVHGNPETEAIWGPLRTELGRDDVIALSPPGFGSLLPEGFAAQGSPRCKKSVHSFPLKHHRTRRFLKVVLLCWYVYRRLVPFRSHPADEKAEHERFLLNFLKLNQGCELKESP